MKKDCPNPWDPEMFRCVVKRLHVCNESMTFAKKEGLCKRKSELDEGVD